MKPKLRFKEFSDEWEEKKLGDIATCTIGLVTTMTENYVENGEGTPLIRNSDIYENRLEKLNHLINLDLGFAEQHKHRFLHTDDIITVHTGDIGTSTVISDLYDGSLSFAGLQTRVNSSLICPIYLSWYFNSFYAKKFFLKMSTGDGRNNLNLKDFKRLIVPIPTLLEQEKIGQFLSLVDKRIEKQEQRIELLKERKKGWMQKIFNQEIRFKDENGDDYPDWEEKKLGDVGKFIKGKGLSKGDIVDNGKYPCILYGELYTKYGEVINHIYSRTNYCGSVEISTGNEVLIPSSGESSEEIAQASYLAYENVLLGGDINIFQTLENGIYISYFLNQNAKRLSAMAQGATVVHLYTSVLEKVKVNIPSLPEQEKIAGFLSKQDELIEQEEKKLELLKEQKKGLLQQMFV